MSPRGSGQQRVADAIVPTGFDRLIPLTVAGLVLLYVLITGLDGTPYDDSFFFKRFVLNFIRSGVFAWNVEDGPVYGNTSQSLQLLATLVTRLTGEWYVLVTKGLSMVALAGAFALLVRICSRQQGNIAPLWIWFASPLVLATMHTGMETALVVFLLSAYFALVRPDEAAPLRPLPAAALTVLIYLTRPDAALLPVGYTLWTHWRSRRRAALRYAGLFTLLLGVCFLVLRLYYGTALPLSFYAKTFAFGHYQAEFVQAGWIWKLRYVLTLAVFAAPSLWIARFSRSRVVAALLVVSLVYCAYHLLMTNEVMGYHARFYLPAAVPLALAGALAFKQFRARASFSHNVRFTAIHAGVTLLLVELQLVEAEAGSRHTQIGLLVYACHLGATAWLLCLHQRARLPVVPVIGVVLLGVEVIAQYPPHWPGWLEDREFVDRYSSEVTTVRGLARVAACFPEPLHVYHSEIGATGLVLPRSTITDLAGLMSPAFGSGAASFERRCSSDRPEVLFLPHRSYAALNREILASRCITAYTRMVGNSSSPLYVRNDRVADFVRCDAQPER